MNKRYCKLEKDKKDLLVQLKKVKKQVGRLQSKINEIERKQLEISTKNQLKLFIKER